MQKNSPKQSPYRLLTRKVSQYTIGKKSVSTLKYRTRTEIPQKILKLASPGITDTAPEKKARELVKDVIVMEGPACLSASYTLFSGGK